MHKSKPPQILVIDDNEADNAILRHALERTGDAYELEILSDGKAALEFVDEHRRGVREPHPCVIVLDLHLPKHSGIEVLASIRTAPALAHIKVVVLSGFAHPEEQIRVQLLGAVYHEKPSHLTLWLELAVRLLALCKESTPPGLLAHSAN